jgi:hypothetical protein
VDPGSGKDKKSGSESGIRNEQPGSYFLELGNHFLGLKYLNSLMRIWDPDPGQGDGKIWIQDLESGKTSQIRNIADTLKCNIL